MIHLADVSEFQGNINWPAYGRACSAVIVRAHNGSRPDKRWVANRSGARANVRTRGWYQYLLKSVSPEAQAAGFCNVVEPLQPGEFVCVDVEEGAGSQVERAQAWMDYVDHRLSTRSWLYSGQAFAQAHLGSLVPFATRNVWLANYRSRPPDLPCTLWQHTDAEAHAGIVKPCDCSIYHGTAEEFAELVGGGVVPVPVPTPPVVVTPLGDHMHRVDVPVPSLNDGTGHWDLDGAEGRPLVPWDKFGAVSVNGGGNPDPAFPCIVQPANFNNITRLWLGGFTKGATPMLLVLAAD